MITKLYAKELNNAMEALNGLMCLVRKLMANSHYFHPELD